MLLLMDTGGRDASPSWHPGYHGSHHESECSGIRHRLLRQRKAKPRWVSLYNDHHGSNIGRIRGVSNNQILLPRHRSVQRQVIFYG